VVPPVVIEALNAIPESTYFFWTGLSTPKTAAGIWQESLKRLFVLAGIPDGHAHRFRDLLGWTVTCWRTHRARVNYFGASERANYGEALRALGSCASRAVGGRCSSHLGNSWTATKGTRRVHEKTHAC